MRAFRVLVTAWFVAANVANVSSGEDARPSDSPVPAGVVARLGVPVRSSVHQAVAIAFSQDGDYLATWNDSRRELTWWKIPSGRQLKTVYVEVLPEDKPADRPNHTDDGSLQCFAFSPDMQRMAVPLYLNRTIVQCSTSTGKRLHKAMSSGHMAAPCFSADSSRFCLGGDGEPFRVFDTQSGELFREITPAGARAGQLMGSWMNPQYHTGMGYVWSSGAEWPRLLLEKGRLLATEDFGGTRFYDVKSGKLVSELPDYGVRAISADGRLAATVTRRTVTDVHGSVLTTAVTVLVWNMPDLLQAAQGPPKPKSWLDGFLRFN